VVTIWGAREKRSNEPIYKPDVKNKVINSDNFSYRKVGRAITSWGAIQTKYCYRNIGQM
jgi:hypothetical protein